jgi:hypothetical protein
MKLELFRQLSQKYSNINFVRIGPVGAKFYAGGQIKKETDITKLTVAFGNSANALQNHVKTSPSRP